MWKRLVFDLGLILPVIFERLLEPVQRVLHVALAECFAEVQAQRRQRQRFAGWLAQSHNLHSVNVEVLAYHEIKTDSARDIRQFSAQIRKAARAEQLSKACTLGIHRVRLAALDC